jgi:hypothetical protein
VISAITILQEARHFSNPTTYVTDSIPASAWNPQEGERESHQQQDVWSDERTKAGKLLCVGLVQSLFWEIG